MAELMSGVLETTWKEVAMAESRYHSGICLEEVRKTTISPLKIAGVPAKI
jgi:hypothetical protein